MTSKWAVNLAVRQSSMPPPRRLIMFALSDVADPTTGVIPDDRTPSLREISEWTGLDKSTVTRHLDALDAEGWVIRERPALEAARRDHVRTTYRLDIGHGAQDTMPEGTEAAEETGMVQPAPSPTDQTGQSMVQPAPRHGAENTMGMVHSAPVPYTDEVTNDKTTSTSANAPKPKRRPSKQKSPPDRPEVEALCQHLADRMVANGCKRPRINDEWRVETARLIDLDGRTPEQIRRCIDWATSNRFWRKNILSMPKLRAKYDQLRMAAEEERERAMHANGRASPRRDLVEHNGMQLKPETIADLERRKRFEAMDANQLAIGGPG